jgi:signal transduction histidine kinase
MKTPKLYIKFFLTFLAIFVVTELMIFSFFHYVVGKKMAAHMADVNRYAVTSLIEDRLSKTPGINPQENPHLRKLLVELGRVYHANVWITQNKMIICSSEITPCITPGNCPRGITSKHDKDFQGYGGRFFSAAISLPDGRTGILNMALRPPPRQPHDLVFAMGLGGIGVIIALMLFPLYRFISRPLGELRDTAMVIASGDLSARAPVRSSDEIGELANAFNKMADNVERMVKSTRELTANISHELRSPLARILVAEELLGEKLGHAENVRRYLESIREETGEIDRMIGDILRLSKLDMNVANAQRADFDIAEILRDLIGRWDASAEYSGISLDLDIPGCPVIVHAMKDDISRALDDLIANAIKFSDGNGPVSIKLEVNASRILIGIRNTCAPLSGEELDKIFEPFYRVPGSTPQGTGLGLTIARKIAENNGGSLNASSWESGIEMLFSIPYAGNV